MRVGDGDRQTHALESRHVIDIVTDIRYLRQRQSILRRPFFERRRLFRHAVDALSIQFRSTYGYNRIRFCRQNEYPDAGVACTREAQTVAAPACHRFDAILIDSHGVIGEHAVKIENDRRERRQPISQIGAEQRHSVVVTHATVLSRTSTSLSNVTMSSCDKETASFLPRRLSYSNGARPPPGDFKARSAAEST